MVVEKSDSEPINNEEINKEGEFPDVPAYFKDCVEDTLDVLKCPNCEEISYINGKCSECGLGLGEDFIRSGNGERLLFLKQTKPKSKLNSQEDDKKVYVPTLGLGSKIYYYNYENRIKDGEGLLEFEDNGKIYKVKVSYSIREFVDYTNTEYNKSKIVNNVFFKKQKGSNGNHNILKKVGEKRIGINNYSEKRALQIVKEILMYICVNKKI